MQILPAEDDRIDFEKSYFCSLFFVCNARSSLRSVIVVGPHMRTPLSATWSGSKSSLSLSSSLSSGVLGSNFLYFYTAYFVCNEKVSAQKTRGGGSQADP